MNTLLALYMFYMCLSMATTIRIGQALGAQEEIRGRLIMRMIMLVVVNCLLVTTTRQLRDVRKYSEDSLAPISE